MLLSLYIIAVVSYAIFIYGKWDSKKIPTIIIVAIALALAGGSYEMADYASYESIYNMMHVVDSLNSLDIMTLYGYGNGDLGYLFINLLFNKMGWSFSEFRFVMIVVVFFIMMRECSKYTKHICFVMFCYTLYPLFIDGIQFRNYFVEIALLLAISQLVPLKSINKVIYIMILIIGATFHKIALIYIPFVLWLELKRFFCGRIVRCFLLIIGCVSPIFTDYILANVDKIYILLLEGGQYANYVSDYFGIRRYIAYVCVLASVILTSFAYKQIEEDDESLHKRFVYIVKEFFLYMIVLSPVFLLSRELSRVPRNALLLLYMVAGIYLQSITRKNIRIIMAVIFVLGCAIYGYVDFYMYEGAKNLITILKYNYLYDYFE